jgi:N-acetylneuraminic acid mutarotase
MSQFKIKNSQRQTIGFWKVYFTQERNEEPMNRRTWLLIAAALFAISALTALGTVANASLPTDPGSVAQSLVVAPEQQSKDEPFDCSQIDAKNINKQMNLRAAQIMADCGRGEEVIPQVAVKGSGGDFSPDAYGGTDINVHPSSSTAIQSETFSWYNASTNMMLVLYNDLSGGSTGKGSYSTDGGVTFARLPGTPFATGHGSNLGDPAVVYDVLHGKWIATWLATACGGQGVGAWTSADGITWTAGGCAANAGTNNGDRNSAWQDNTPSSPFYGRSYISYQDFGISGGALRAAWSTDGGTTWAPPVTVVNTFIRDVQLTGMADGTLVLAGMNEGGGGAANRTNMFYRSTDGGATWSTITANTYPPPGNVNCSGNSYFRVITPQIRHMGWGQPAGGPGGVVHYAYAAHGTATDEGDIYYIRSTDSGVTWSTPLLMNTDGGTRAQWMPSVGVTPGGAVFVKWYDRRDTSNNDYWIYGRASLDNGVTWQPDMAVSDAVIPQPIVQTGNCYMGDYDYWHGDGTTVQGAWTDSRGSGSGGTQDVFHDNIGLLQGTPTPTVTGTPPTATQTATRTSTQTATSTPCAVLNEGFESGTLGQFNSVVAQCVPGGCGWTSTTSNPHSGTRSAFEADRANVSDVYLQLTSAVVPASGGQLIFWHSYDLEDTFDGGVLEASTNGGTTWTDMAANMSGNTYTDLISSSFGSPISGRQAWSGSSGGYVQTTVNLTPYAGQNLLFRFRLATDNSVAAVGWNIDDIIIGGTCATVTGTPPTATATRTSTVAATSTSTTVVGTATATACAGGSATWTDMAPIPALRGRAAGATVGNNIYVFGGRPASTTYTDTIYRYDTVANTWTLLATVLPDLNTSNMAAAVLTFPEGQRIFIAGGSGANSFVTARTLAFNPTDNTITTKATWPAAPLRIPGGWTVVNNKLYIFGGFEPADIMHTDIWMYDPMTDTWTESSTELGTARGYIATELMPDGMVYLAGGMSGDLTDLTTFEKFNPATQAITAGPDLPQPKSNNHGYNIGGKFYMPTGGIEDANLDETTWVYDPGTNAWSTTTPTLHAVRNYSKGYGADGSIYVIGGADSLGSTFFDFTQKLTVSTGGPCSTATSTAVVPTATNSVVVSTATNTTVASATNTVAPTATACTVSFTDVDVNNPFYTWIRCLACRGIIGGYDDGTFRPFNDITRGQIAKIVSNAAGFDEDPGPQIYEDVDGSNPFYQWINRLSMRGHMGGYPCGTVAAEPCLPPGNRPYFRPFNNATRGQLAKIVANAAGVGGTPTGLFYTDVPEDNPFYIWIMRLTQLGVMSGYDCGGPGEPCDSQNRPYFRPYNNVTRGQASKIVANTFFPGCQTPARPLPAEASR